MVGDLEETRPAFIARGLRCPKLVVEDGHLGIRSGLRNVYPEAREQRVLESPGPLGRAAPRLPEDDRQDPGQRLSLIHI